MVLKGIMIRRLTLLLSPCPRRLSVPTTLNRTPFSRIVLPIEGRPGNRTLRASSPITTTARFCSSSQHIQPPPVSNRRIADLVEVALHAHQLPAGLKKIADRANISPLDYRGRLLHIGTFRTDVEVILISQRVLTAYC